ncbi:hypothetical protein [Paraburkholderia fungorum]
MKKNSLRDYVSLHFAYQPPSGGFSLPYRAGNPISSDFAMPGQPLHLFEQKRQCKLRRSRLFPLLEQSPLMPHAGEHSGTNIDNISPFTGNFCTISRVVGEFQVRFTGFH